MPAAPESVVAVTPPNVERIADVGVYKVLAQAAGEAGGAPALPEMLLQYAPLLFVVLFAWLLLYRPERQRQVEAERLRNALKKNDRVVTASGLYGIVAAVDRDNDRVTLKIDESNNVKVDVTLASIARVFGGDGVSQGGAGQA